MKPNRTRPRHLAIDPRSAWSAVALAVACSLGIASMLGADRAGVPRVLGFAAGALAGALAVFGLPSIPTRVAATAMLGMGGFIVIRHAQLADVDLRVIGLWGVVTLAAFALMDRVAQRDLPPVRGAGRDAPVVGRVVTDLLKAGVFIVVATLVLAPLLARGNHIAPVDGGRAADRSDPDAAGTGLRASDRLDTSQRPRLSDRVVMTVEARRAQLWRAETFDRWDGRSWTRSDLRAWPLSVMPSGAAVVQPEPGDAAAGDGDVLVQRVRIEAPYAELMVAAATPVSVRSVHSPVQRPDATLVAIDPMGQGSTYTVVSRVPRATPASLRASDRVARPAAVLARYGQPEVTTARVVELAAELMRDEPTTYDKVRALERWMGRNLEYSLDAPVSRPGRDVVDDFLFLDRVGWCEQIATSLVVMLRSQGIPARLATGFVPGERSPLRGSWTVRERDAHAWAEVYFPGIGWQGFDPTADVPLAQETAPARSWTSALGHWLADRWQTLAVVALVAVALLGGARALQRVRRRSRRTWAQRTWSRLERVGRRAGRPRAAGETVLGYARALGAHLGDERIAEVGEVLDSTVYGHGGPPDAASRATDRIDALLDELEGRRRLVASH